MDKAAERGDGRANLRLDGVMALIPGFYIRNLGLDFYSNLWYISKI